jgi:hypothetical protein
MNTYGGLTRLDLSLVWACGSTCSLAATRSIVVRRARARRGQNDEPAIGDLRTLF